MKASSDWREFELGELLTLINGRAYKQDELLDAGTPVLRIQNLNGGERWYYSDLSLPADKMCNAGDLLYAWSGSFGPYVWSGPKSIFHYHIWKIALTNRLDQRFAYYLLDHITARVKAAGRGVSMLHMTKSGMEAWKVRVPPLEEQKRIAAILDQADALRRLRARALDRLNALGQAIFHEMFGVRIADGELPLAELGSLARNLDGKRVPVKKSDRGEVQGKFPYYGASGVIDFVDDFLFEGPHLLVAEDGANLLSRSTPIAFIADGQFWVNNHAHVLAYNGLAELDFLRFFLQTLDLAPYITGSAQPKLNQKKLNQILVPVPHLADQRQFVAILRELEQQISEVERSQVATTTLFTSLQHRAFRGEL